MNVGLFARCVVASEELTASLLEEQEKLGDQPGDARFAAACLSLRDQLLERHGISLQEWFAFNQQPSLFGFSPVKAAA